MNKFTDKAKKQEKNLSFLELIDNLDLKRYSSKS